MITGSAAMFDLHCRMRGYTLAEVAPCIVSRNGLLVTVDETHPAYPLIPKKPAALAPVFFGPGTHLSRLLATFGITYTPGCKCGSMAAKMDALGCEWCESDEGMGEILEAMRTEAAKRSLPFLDAVGRLLVRRAVKAARKEAARGTEATGREGGNQAAV